MVVEQDARRRLFEWRKFDARVAQCDRQVRDDDCWFGAMVGSHRLWMIGSNRDRDVVFPFDRCMPTTFRLRSADESTLHDDETRVAQTSRRLGLLVDSLARPSRRSSRRSSRPPARLRVRETQFRARRRLDVAVVARAPFDPRRKAAAEREKKLRRSDDRICKTRNDFLASSRSLDRSPLSIGGLCALFDHYHHDDGDSNRRLIMILAVIRQSAPTRRLRPSRNAHVT